MIREKLKRGLRAIVGGLSRFGDNHAKTTLALKSILIGWSAIVLGYVNLKLNKPLWLQDEIRAYLSDHWGFVGVMLSWPLVASLFVSWSSDVLAAFRDANEITSEAWYTVIKAINDVVGLKTKRFGQFARTMRGMTRGAAFEEITQPDKQMEALMVNLHHVLVQLSGDKSLRLVLARMESDIPVAGYIFEPKDAVPPSDLFTKNAKKTLFHSCAVARNTIVIPDIGKELQRKGKQRRYVPSDVASDNEGSIMCHPLIHPYCNQVLYCLSVKSEYRNRVNADFYRKYLFIVESFAKRILLEASLDMIKKEAMP